RSWLDECLDQHEECPKNLSSILPTRVLDLGLSNAGSDRTVKLHNSCGGQGSYVALSYCWGGPQFMTVKANVVESYEGLPIHRLAKSIQDAIFVTRQLGIRYLWVDALCIIQDCLEDKYREIGKMSSIYKNATLTISVARSKTCHDGFLHDNEELKTWLRRAYRLQCRLPEDLGNIYLAERSKLKSKKEPIDLRTWTLQESWLSPRLLIYSSSHLLWRCLSATAGDGTCTPCSPTLTRSDSEFEEGHLFHTNFHLQWNDLVHEATSRNLSVDSDKLPALSGIATELASRNDDVYLAGLWKSNLISGLLWCQGSRWCMSSSSIPASKPAVSRAPTWSWVSVNGSVDLNNAATRHATQSCVHTCEISLASAETPFGEVKGGVLDITAPIKR
ncbi:HET-domain-containing protein, partial [Lepidopterella palustris CBS 459.81]